MMGHELRRTTYGGRRTRPGEVAMGKSLDRGGGRQRSSTDFIGRGRCGEKRNDHGFKAIDGLYQWRGVTAAVKFLECRGNGRGCSASVVLAVVARSGWTLAARCRGSVGAWVALGLGSEVARRVGPGACSCSARGRAARNPARASRLARLGGSRGRCRDGSAWSVELQGRSVGRGRGAVPGIARVRARKDRGGERVGRDEGEVARERRLCRDERPAGGGRRQGATVAGRWAKWAFRVRLGWVFSFLFFISKYLLK
jgi:hypothetical protein